MTSLRSPLSRVLGHGSARAGVSHWWVQRLTSVALIPLTAWFGWSVLRLESFGHATVAAWLQSPLNALGTVLLVLTLAWHSSLGLQVVIEDYVHHHGLKLFAVVTNKFAHAALAAVGTFAVLWIAFGATA